MFSITPKKVLRCKQSRASRIAAEHVYLPGADLTAGEPICRCGWSIPADSLDALSGDLLAAHCHHLMDLWSVSGFDDITLAA